MTEPSHRIRLGNRRHRRSWRVDVWLSGDPESTPLHIDAGFDAMLEWQNGRLRWADPPIVRETFVCGRHKVGTRLDRMLEDEATSISLHLQAGYTPAGLRARLGAADVDGRPLTFMAAICDELIKIQALLAQEFIEHQRPVVAWADPQA